MGIEKARAPQRKEFTSRFIKNLVVEVQKLNKNRWVYTYMYM